MPTVIDRRAWPPVGLDTPTLPGAARGRLFWSGEVGWRDPGWIDVSESNR